MGMVIRRLQISPNVFGRTTEGGKAGLRKITEAGVGKNGVAKPKRVFKPIGMPRPVVEGMDTQGRVLKKAKKYWMWIVAAFVAYFLFRGK